MALDRTSDAGVSWLRVACQSDGPTWLPGTESGPIASLRESQRLAPAHLVRSPLRIAAGAVDLNGTFLAIGVCAPSGVDRTRILIGSYGT